MCHKSEFEQGWTSEGSHSPAAALGLALRRDVCHFPDAALGPGFLLLLLLGVSRKGQGGGGQSGSGCRASITHWLGPVWTDSRCRTGEHRITPTTQLPAGFLAHPPAPGSWGVCAQQPEWECLSRTSGHSLSLLPSFPWPLHPGSPILTPGSMSGTHLPAPNYWAASWTSFILNRSLSQPCLAEASMPPLSPAPPPDTDKHPPPPPAHTRHAQPSLVLASAGGVVRAWKQHPSP